MTPAKNPNNEPNNIEMFKTIKDVHIDQHKQTTDSHSQLCDGAKVLDPQRPITHGDDDDDDDDDDDVDDDADDYAWQRF